MTISIEFLDGLYRRKHEQISSNHHYDLQIKLVTASLEEKTGARGRANSEAQLQRWKECLAVGKYNLMMLEILIPEYIKTHGDQA
jgi:hypothetical protein